MTDSLSPAALAVRKACYSTDDDLVGPASAVLRAAAGLEVSSNFDGTLYETGEDEFRAFLLAIAAELEGING